MLHPDEVAADKTLALFGRAAARDLVDVDALSRRYTRQQLFDLAAEKDPGFDPRMFADALRAATRHADAAFAELGLDAAARGSLRGRAEEWRVQLLSEAPPPNPVVSGDRLPEAAHRPTSEPAPEKPRWPSSNPPPASTGPGQEPPAVR